jgi:predicted deacylase
MPRDLKVGTDTVAPGEKAASVQHLALAGHRVDVPLFVANGAEAGPCLVVTAGLHGAEYASIAAALRLGRSLQPETLRGRVIVAPIVNMPGFRTRAMHICPLDGRNVNRVFPGDPHGSASEQLAAWLVREVIRHADYYVDLHDGDLTEAIIPFAVYHPSGDASLDEQMLEMVLLTNIATVVRREVPGTATDYAGGTLGIPSIVIEGGGQGMWPPEAVAVHTQGLDRLMRHWGLLAGPKPEPTTPQIVEEFIWLTSEHEGYYYPEVTPGEEVHRRQSLGTVTDLAGSVLQVAAAPVDCQVLVVQTSLAVNEGDLLVAVGA